MEETFENSSVKDTMDIIINAGDARAYIYNAIDDIANYDYISAKKNMNKANDKLVIAHRLQTKKLQLEAEGDNINYSVLFTHAQDTLMTIMSEFNLIKHLIIVFEKRDKGKDDKQ